MIKQSVAIVPCQLCTILILVYNSSGTSYKCSRGEGKSLYLMTNGGPVINLNFIVQIFVTFIFVSLAITQPLKHDMKASENIMQIW